MITVVELPLFVKQVEDLFDDDERAKIIEFLASHPLDGDVIPGTGGIRKVRVQASGRGKRGGARVIYFYYDQSIPLYALSVYKKKQKETLSEAEKKTLTKLAAIIKAQARRDKNE
nr:type II toxin-antitoxin system RelE/ParE family toxin [uncultured Cohaesibacter sp.]